MGCQNSTAGGAKGPSQRRTTRAMWRGEEYEIGGKYPDPTPAKGGRHWRSAPVRSSSNTPHGSRRVSAYTSPLWKEEETPVELMEKRESRPSTAYGYDRSSSSAFTPATHNNFSYGPKWREKELRKTPGSNLPHGGYSGASSRSAKSAAFGVYPSWDKGMTDFHNAALVGDDETLERLFYSTASSPPLSAPSSRSMSRRLLAEDEGSFEASSFDSSLSTLEEAPHGQTTLTPGERRVRATTGQGWTPLHFAAAQGHVSTVWLLISMGALPDARTVQGKTAFDLAKDNRKYLVETSSPPLFAGEKRADGVETPPTPSREGHHDFH